MVTLGVLLYTLINRIKVKNKRKLYCIIVCIIISLVMGLRSRYVGGVDTDLSYIPLFYKICNVNEKCVRTFCAFWRINVQFARRKAYFSTLDKFFSEITTELFPYMSHLWTQKKTGAFTYKTNKT